MSEKQTEETKPAAAAVENRGPETQQQRWMKYGANVVLVSVVAVLLGVVAVALAGRPAMKAQIDTTQAGLFSLKAQTKAILKDLKQDVRIVSLYAKTKPVPGRENEYIDVATPVADLLDEYKRNGGGKIEVEVIDPIETPSKV